MRWPELCYLDLYGRLSPQLGDLPNSPTVLGGQSLDDGEYLALPLRAD